MKTEASFEIKVNISGEERKLNGRIGSTLFQDALDKHGELNDTIIVDIVERCVAADVKTLMSSYKSKSLVK